MTTVEQESILTLSLMAAFADGAKNDAERAEVRRIAEGLPQAGVQITAAPRPGRPRAVPPAVLTRPERR